jgi:tetratricopeptide (TPR) repeat protein
MFDRVIALDPDYLPARSGLAISLSLIPAWSRSLALGESLDLINRAKQEARLVIERQPGNAEAWSALGLIYSSYDWRWKEAGEAVARSLALAPNDAEVVNFAGDYYRLVLADPQTLEAEKRAVELNPLQGVNHNDLAVCHLAFHHYELGIEPGRRAISISPNLVENYDALFRAYGFLRRLDEMREVLAAARRIAPAGSAILANMEIMAAIFEGRKVEALRLLEEFRPHVEQGGYSPAEYGYNYLWLGHPDKALPWLMLGVKGRDLSMVDRYTVDLDFVAAHPVTRVVLDDPSLKELMELRARNLRAAQAQK